MHSLGKIIYLYIVLLFVILCGGSYALGNVLAYTKNIKQTELFIDFNPALPSRILDIRGDLITEFSMEEKREIVDFENISPNIIHALLAREDRRFFEHRGFSLKAIIRAAVGKLTGKSLGGGSTITQQIAGLLYCDRTDMRIKRKIQELWWAIQMERRYSKDEIMKLYLNEVYFGGGTYGVGAASRFYFGHSAAELTPAESAILIIQLSNPSHYNPFENPNIAKERQEYVLEGMVDLGYITNEEASNSFEDYWAGFDYTRISLSAWFTRQDKARWFSEYVRRELEGMMYGTMNLYTDGYVVHTTCDLRHQAAADKEMSNYIEIANQRVKRSSSSRFSQGNTYSNITALLSLTCNINSLHLGDKQLKIKADKYFKENINPLLDVSATMLGMDGLKAVSQKQAVKSQEALAEKMVEGTFVSLENETGYITALVGGSKFDESNQLIRATQAKLQVGSAIKPLIYSAAIEARKITAATVMDDTPQVFENAAGVQYIPNNFNGKWHGTVLVWEALPRSLNIPAISVLDKIGFDAAINHTAALIGMTDKKEIERTFERVYPMALGIASLTPIQLGRAFAVFGNQGRAVEPIAIRSIENRNGYIVADPEKDLRISQRKKGTAVQVVSPQNAYIMTSILKNSLTIGTMYGSTSGGRKFIYKDPNTGKSFQMPIAGKTGTTQNWSASWAAAYSPYYTAIAWFGFDRGNTSLGLDNTGAGLAAYPVANYMSAIHEGKPYKDFVRPETGLAGVNVCKKSGLLPTEACGDETVFLYFLSGTAPASKCTYHEAGSLLKELGVERLRLSGYSMGEIPLEIDETELSIDPAVFQDFEDDIPDEETDDAVMEDSKEASEIEEAENTEENEVNPWL